MKTVTTGLRFAALAVGLLSAVVAGDCSECTENCGSIKSMSAGDAITVTSTVDSSQCASDQVAYVATITYYGIDGALLQITNVPSSFQTYSSTPSCYQAVYSTGDPFPTPGDVDVEVTCANSNDDCQFYMTDTQDCMSAEFAQTYSCCYNYQAAIANVTLQCDGDTPGFGKQIINDDITVSYPNGTNIAPCPQTSTAASGSTSPSASASKSGSTSTPAPTPSSESTPTPTASVSTKTSNSGSYAISSAAVATLAIALSVASYVATD